MKEHTISCSTRERVYSAHVLHAGSRNSMDTGYPYRFSDEALSRKYTCSICTFVARDPRQVICCGNVFCKYCLRRYSHSNTRFTCPVCRDDTRRNRNFFKDRRAEREILSMKVHCMYEGEGCDWQGEVREAEGHECVFKPVPCENNCGEMIQSIFLEDHLKLHCVNRRHACSECQEEGTYKFITGNHIDSCPNLLISCTSEDCGETVQRKDLEQHLTQCPHHVIKCSNKCGKKMKRCILAGHLKFRCKRRLVSCMHCKEEGTHVYITRDHVNECPALPVLCPNYGCNMTFSCSLIDAHRKSCPKEAIQCEYHSIGCVDAVLRENVASHGHNCMEQHLLLATRKIKAMEAEFEGKNTRTFKVSSFAKRKEDGEEWFSPGIYTSSSSGYKLGISVDFGGQGEGKGSHISCYVHLMPGKIDDTLEWPFQGKVTIELLNQLEDKNHCEDAIELDETVPVGIRKKVTGRRRRGEGWGEEKFIAHCDLEHDPKNNIQYLKNDSLYFRVNIKVYSKTKSWLYIHR